MDVVCWFTSPLLERSLDTELIAVFPGTGSSQARSSALPAALAVNSVKRGAGYVNTSMCMSRGNFACLVLLLPADQGAFLSQLGSAILACL